MRRIWLYSLPLVFAACLSAAANAAGRSGPDSAPIAAANADAAAQGPTQTYVFADALRPHGKARSQAAKIADGRVCGASADNDLPANIPAFQRCMATHGWKLDHVATTAAPEPYVRPGSVGVWTYDDARLPQGRARGEAQEQADTRACDGGDADAIGSAAFRSCMNRHGWRLASFDPARQEPDAASQEEASAPSDPGPDIIAEDQQQELVDSNLAAQQLSNDALAQDAQNIANAWVAPQ
jgi:hypothetical protein